jgi:hypothetical protein
MSCRAVHPARFQVDHEVVLGVSACRVTHRWAFGAHLETIGGHLGSGGPIGVGRVADDHRLFGLVTQVADQGVEGVTVGNVGRGGGHLVDDLRVGIDTDVGL